MKVRAIQCDAMLLSWGETHNGGAKISLQLSSPEDLEAFKSMTLKKGKMAGQLLTCVFVEQDGNGNPVDPEAPAAPKGKAKFPDGFCGLAVMWCGEPNFCAWLFETFPDFEALCPTSYLVDPVSAAWMVRAICGVKSRKELNTDDIARGRFDTLIREPYMAHRKEHGLE